MGPQSNAAADRSTIKFGEQRLAVPQDIDFVGICLRPQAATLQQPAHTATDFFNNPGHFLVAGRRHTPEYDLTLFVFEV